MGESSDIKMIDMRNQDEIKKSITKAFDVHDISAFMHVSPLAQQLMDSPDQTIPKIRETYETALDQAYTRDDGVNVRAWIQSMAGGPFEVIPWAIYNSVGAAYPYFTRPQKDLALRQMLNILDTRNTMEITGDGRPGHTTGIREPLLLADICVCRPYWPGIEEGLYVISQFSCFSDFSKTLMNSDGTFKHKGRVHYDGEAVSGVNSDFMVAYALLRTDLCKWGETFVKKAHPPFLERVLKGLMTYCFAHRTEEADIQKELNDCYRVLPELVHSRLRPIVKEKDWPDRSEFP